MTVITQLCCQLYITRQLHVSANTIFGHHHVGYNYWRKLHITIDNTEWPKKMYTLFTHQYLWNKFK